MPKKRRNLETNFSVNQSVYLEVGLVLQLFFKNKNALFLEVCYLIWSPAASSWCPSPFLSHSLSVKERKDFFLSLTCVLILCSHVSHVSWTSLSVDFSQVHQQQAWLPHLMDLYIHFSISIEIFSYHVLLSV